LMSVQGLVTQVDQNQDPAAQAELAKLQAAEYARKKKEQEKTPTPKPDVKEDQHSCCWRFFCCCFTRKASKPTATPKGDTPVDVPKPQPVVPAEPEPAKKWLLGPLEVKGQKTLVLDLDETLVHSSFRPVPSPDFVISIDLDGVTHRVYVQKRPGVDEFLEQVASKFEVVVFTASLGAYANPVMDILDPKGFIKVRLFRESCVQHYGNYVKDLSLLGRKLEHTLIIDNSPFSYMFQPDNAIPCTSWFNDKLDRELYDLVPFLLEQIVPAEDVVKVITERKQLVMSAGGQVEMVGGGEGEEGEEEEDEDGGS